MKFEEQLAAIQSKAEMHKFVDELPDGSKGVFIAEIPDEEDSDGRWMRFREVGQTTVAEALYFIRSYEHWLFAKMHSKDD